MIPSQGVAFAASAGFLASCASFDHLFLLTLRALVESFILFPCYCFDFILSLLFFFLSFFCFVELRFIWIAFLILDPPQVTPSHLVGSFSTKPLQESRCHHAYVFATLGTLHSIPLLVPLHNPPHTLEGHPMAIRPTIPINSHNIHTMDL